LAPNGVPDISVRGLTKRYGDVVAVDAIDLDIAPGEFFTMLGPSGSGKTTTLRMIAGFEIPDAGTIELAGEDVSRLPPYDRPVNTVFQDYALFPHMTVQQNVEYGLMVKRVKKGERRRRAEETLEMVRLGGYGDRKPSQLSGGQRQRVALARAIINRPKVLLLDEPLGALDLKLREQLQIELKQIQKVLGMTFVYVTHDQEEALTMSDRIAVMSAGRVEQVGQPKEIYEAPATAYVADFLGVSNLMSAMAAGVGDGGCKVTVGEFSLIAGEGDADTVGECKITIRPERVEIQAQGETGENHLPAMVERIVYVGSVLQVILHLATGQTIQAWMPNTGAGDPFRSGDAVAAHFPREALRVLPEGGTAVLEEAELDVSLEEKT
jgi:spermidine/putrescine ABC transporter ATP-binding subunit